MSTHVPVFQLFFRRVASFCIGQISHQQHNLRVKNIRTLSMTNWVKPPMQDGVKYTEILSSQNVFLVK